MNKTQEHPIRVFPVTQTRVDGFMDLQFCTDKKEILIVYIKIKTVKFIGLSTKRGKYDQENQVENNSDFFVCMTLWWQVN